MGHLLFLNGGSGDTHERGLEQLANAHSLEIGCSYLQPRGWLILRSIFGAEVLARSKLVFTDQLAITSPQAVRMAIADEVLVRRFNGGVTYHPKCILSIDEYGNPRKFLLGSANISASALQTGVEVGILGTDAANLVQLHEWFQDLFTNRSEAVTSADLTRMEEAWKAAAAARARSRLAVTTAAGRARLTEPPPSLTETYEDAFDALIEPIGMLNFDHAGNNVRTLDRARLVLQDWPEVSGKAASEMKLLGMASEGSLTALGIAAAASRTNEELASIWCKWLVSKSQSALLQINPRLAAAREALTKFWRLGEEVTSFFIANSTERTEKRLLQTIELLCSASSMVEKLTLADLRVLSNLLPTAENMDPHVASIIADYFENKGARGWDLGDRETIVKSFRNAMNSS